MAWRMFGMYMGRHTQYLEGAGLSNAHEESNLPNTAAL